MNKAIKLPDVIINIFKLAEKLAPNSTAFVRPALQNNLLISHHPASCRALKASEPQQQPTV
jgi:hypothetical protein